MSQFRARRSHCHFPVRWPGCPRPELWPDYFGHYRRVVWLAQSRDPALAAEAAAIGAMFGLPLQVVEVGTASLERELELLVHKPQQGGPTAGDPAAGELRADEVTAGELTAGELTVATGGAP